MNETPESASPSRVVLSIELMPLILLTLSLKKLCCFSFLVTSIVLDWILPHLRILFFRGTARKEAEKVAGRRRGKVGRYVRQAVSAHWYVPN